VRAASGSVVEALKFVESAAVKAASVLGFVVLGENILGMNFSGSYVTMYVFMLALATITRKWWV
jgi:hypothetical protein